MTNMEVKNKILNNLRAKYTQANEFYVHTREMEIVLKKDDIQAMGLLLAMRDKAMQQINRIDAENNSLLTLLSDGDRGRMDEILGKSGKTITLENPQEKDIYDTQKRIVNVLKKAWHQDEIVHALVQKQKGK